MPKKTSAPALAEALVRARSLAKDMSAATDELNSSLQEVEKEIADLKLGVTARILIESPDEHSPWTAYLRFGKDQQAWRLTWEYGIEGDDDMDTTPLVNASRATRLEAVDHLPDLVEALIATASKEVEKIRSKTKVVRDLVTTIKLGDILS